MKLQAFECNFVFIQCSDLPDSPKNSEITKKRALKEHPI